MEEIKLTITLKVKKGFVAKALHEILTFIAKGTVSPLKFGTVVVANTNVQR
jgi:hypothetical protein